MPNETTTGAGRSTSKTSSAMEQDAESLAAQVETLKSDLAAISSTLSDLVKSSAKEGRRTVERTAEHYVREGRRQADAAVEGARAYGDQLEGQITRNPFSAVLVALGLGFLVGLMSRR